METFLCQDGCCTLKIKPYVAQDLLYENFNVRRKKAGVFICEKVSECHRWFASEQWRQQRMRAKQGIHFLT